MKNLEGLVETIKDKINYISKTETIVGEAITVNDKTFFPLIKIRIGFGLSAVSWSGKKEDESDGKEEDIQGGGSGGGIKISPVAMVYMDKNDVKVLPLPKAKKGLSRILEKIPDLFEKIQRKKSQE